MADGNWKENSVLALRDIILRDFMESDVEKRIYWETVETEWQRWDGPWETEGRTEAQREAELQDYIGSLRLLAAQDLPPEETRHSFQIVVRDTGDYIGWVTSYSIDEEYCFTEGAGFRALGIDIPNQSARGKGYAFQALSGFAAYLLAHGERELYLQTWSGNLRMIHIAEKMGFVECNRKPGLRLVRGKIYDGLTFRLDQRRFDAFRETMGL